MLEVAARRALREVLQRVPRRVHAQRSHMTVSCLCLNDARARLEVMDEDEAVKARWAVDVLWQDYGENGPFWFHGSPIRLP